MRTAGVWFVGLLLLAAPGVGQIVRAGRALDVRSGTYMRDVVIRIEEGRIAEIGRGTATGGAGVIDLSGYTVLPGLIDAHTHLCDNTYMGEAWDWWTFPVPVFGIAGAANADKVLAAGFTTVRDVGDHYYCGVSLRESISNGWISGPRVYASGPYVTMTGGHGAPGNWMAPQHELARPWDGIADGADAVRKAVRAQIKHRVDLIKITATGGFGTHGTIPAAATYTEDEIRAAVEEAAKRGLFVAAHAHGPDGIRNAVEAGVRSIEHGFLMDDESIRLMKERGVFLAADLLAAHFDLVEVSNDWGDKELRSSNAEEYRKYAERVARAHRAGVRIAFATDSGVYPHGRNAEQFALMVAAGIEPLDAIRSATIVAAELLGLEDSAGSIEVGKWADLIAVKGDPLQDVASLTDVRFVMKEGVVVRPIDE